MCGIGGKVSFDGRPASGLGDEMAAEMTHRGPDADGVYASGPAMLSHRRLSILDLSEAGNQPMASEDGSVQIVFNGEIYNYRELRERLDSYTFRSETDTEVLLHLYEEDGIDCLDYLRGMFAFGIWDEDRERLFLARDRLGQKPLFYYEDDGAVTFASTISALLADDAVPVAPDLPAIRQYLTYQYVPSPRTGFTDVRSLRPAEYMVVTDDGIDRQRYWSLSFAEQFDDSPDRLADRLRDELREATRLRMRSDVPLGVFLSGGVDSTIVTGLMDEVSDRPVKTYSIAFDEYDELEFARAVAEKYDTDHTEYTVTPDAMDVLPELVRHCEMPFGDPAAVPTYYVSQVAADDITVAMTGAAGDENFAGYDRYTYDWLTERAAALPRSVRSVGKAACGAIEGAVPAAGRGKRLFEVAGEDQTGRYAPYICHMQGEAVDEIWRGPRTDDELARLRRAFERADGPTRLDRIMHVDIQTYLPDDLLVKDDRASMAHSMELRSPFLDHELVEFAAKIPARYKWRRGDKKWLLERAFADYMPEPVRNRSKQGFHVPVNEWFRGELRSFARDRLEGLGAREAFDSGGLTAKLDRHVDGEADLGYPIWDLVVLEQWYRTFID
ncbi:MAG: asparagine synthase (glutamine-hydrolyzing) [Haloarculaceae archaeon]